MFYSHQLLARKAPLGQIWMAATLHAKFNRKKLDKLDIIQICEEILNPSVPMVFRLSGISMGGVVIVYERKVKLLFDDGTRLLVEINGAWRTKAVPDPTLLKGKTHARKKAVTLPKNEEADFGDVEQTRNLPKFPSFMEFQQTYISMRLDEPNVNENHEQEDLGQQFHQADADNITLFEYLGAHQTDTETYDRFERFDIEGDDETQIKFSAREGVQTPTSLIPSPPRHHDIPEAHQGDEGSMYSIGQKLSIRVGPLKGYLCRLIALRYSDVTMTRHRARALRHRIKAGLQRNWRNLVAVSKSTSRKSEGVNIIWDFGNSWLKEGVTVQMLKPRIQSYLKRHGDFEIKDIYAIGPAGTNFDLIERCVDFTMIKIPNLSKRCGNCNEYIVSQYDDELLMRTTDIADIYAILQMYKLALMGEDGGLLISGDGDFLRSVKRLGYMVAKPKKDSSDTLNGKMTFDWETLQQG